MTYLVSIDIFMCGLATLVQLLRNRYFGIGLPVVLGCAIQAVEPLKMIGKQFTIGTMYGAIIIAGCFVFLIAGQFSRIKKLFPPVVTGTLITVIGLTLIPIAVQNMGGGDATAKSFGSLDSLVLSFLTVVIILVVQRWGRGFLSSIAVLIGLAAGTLIALAMGIVSLAPITEARWFHFPQPFYFGMPQFEWSSSITMIIIALVSMVESTGVFFALGGILNQNITAQDLKRGYRAEGLAQILGGIFNTFPYTTFSQNVGLLQLSGIKTKRPIYWSAGLLMLMGLIPKIGAFATIIPTPVLGGAMLVMFSMISVQGIRMLFQVDFNDQRNMLIVAVSLGLGLGVSVYPTLFEALPRTIQLFLGNGIVVASLSSVLLNIILKGKAGLAEK
jgi:xanthine permease